MHQANGYAMRLKTFSAPSMSEAMSMVKEHFGDDAIIVSSQKGENGLGVRITAAIDLVEEEKSFEEELGFDEFPESMDAISDALSRHGVPGAVTDQILAIANNLSMGQTHLTLAGAFDQVFNFVPVPNTKTAGATLLVGLPGAGKTVTTAKLATQAVMARRPINVITTDTIRAGGFQQLEAFTKILKIDLMSAGDPEALRDAIAAGDPKAATIIDCAGGNPFDERDFTRQQQLIEAVDADVVLLLSDGTDSLEAGDLAEAYRDLGARKLIVTRIDVARRHGALLSAASAGELAICGAGVGPNVTDGLKPLNPVALARLLLPEADDDALGRHAAKKRRIHP
ncbi:MAG: GTPase [Alphaproteobacteria bacterium]|nr:GTPase [Alphaproteobacteria bacterium]